MSRRDRARRRRNRVREYDRQHGPDLSEIVYLFANGWSIRRPGSVEALTRDGQLSGTCLRQLPDAIESGRMTPDGADMLAYTVLSLRDTHNVSHLTFMHVPGNDLGHGYTTEIRGYQDIDPKPEYLEYLDAFHQALPYPVEVVPDLNELLNELPELEEAA